MNWKTPTPRRSPRVGDTRKRIKFALVARDCTDGTTRWLERIVVHEVFKEGYVDEFGPCVYWIVTAYDPYDPLHGDEDALTL